METEFQLAGLAAVPIVIGFLEAAKGMFKPDKRFWPAIGVVIGVIWNLLVAVATTGSPTLLDGLVGAVLGLAASGLYSGAKATIGK